MWSFTNPFVSGSAHYAEPSATAQSVQFVRRWGAHLAFAAAVLAMWARLFLGDSLDTALLAAGVCAAVAASFPGAGFGVGFRQTQLSMLLSIVGQVFGFGPWVHYLRIVSIVSIANTLSVFGSKRRVLILCLLSTAFCLDLAWLTGSAACVGVATVTHTGQFLQWLETKRCTIIGNKIWLACLGALTFGLILPIGLVCGRLMRRFGHVEDPRFPVVVAGVVGSLLWIGVPPAFICGLAIGYSDPNDGFRRFIPWGVGTLIAGDIWMGIACFSIGRILFSNERVIRPFVWTTVAWMVASGDMEMAQCFALADIAFATFGMWAMCPLVVVATIIRGAFYSEAILFILAMHICESHPRFARAIGVAAGGFVITGRPIDELVLGAVTDWLERNFPRPSLGAVQVTSTTDTLGESQPGQHAVSDSPGLDGVTKERCGSPPTGATDPQPDEARADSGAAGDAFLTTTSPGGDDVPDSYSTSSRIFIVPASTDVERLRAKLPDEAFIATCSSKAEIEAAIETAYYHGKLCIAVTDLTHAGAASPSVEDTIAIVRRHYHMQRETDARPEAYLDAFQVPVHHIRAPGRGKYTVFYDQYSTNIWYNKVVGRRASVVVSPSGVHIPGATGREMQCPVRMLEEFGVHIGVTRVLDGHPCVKFSSVEGSKMYVHDLDYLSIASLTVSQQGWRLMADYKMVKDRTIRLPKAMQKKGIGLYRFTVCTIGSDKVVYRIYTCAIDFEETGGTLDPLREKIGRNYAFYLFICYLEQAIKNGWSQTPLGEVRNALARHAHRKRERFDQKWFLEGPREPIKPLKHYWKAKTVPTSCLDCEMCLAVEDYADEHGRAHIHEAKFMITSAHRAGRSGREFPRGLDHENCIAFPCAYCLEVTEWEEVATPGDTKAFWEKSWLISSPPGYHMVVNSARYYRGDQTVWKRFKNLVRYIVRDRGSTGPGYEELLAPFLALLHDSAPTDAQCIAIATEHDAMLARVLGHAPAPADARDAQPSQDSTLREDSPSSGEEDHDDEAAIRPLPPVATDAASEVSTSDDGLDTGAGEAASHDGTSEETKAPGSVFVRGEGPQWRRLFEDIIRGAWGHRTAVIHVCDSFSLREIQQHYFDLGPDRFDFSKYTVATWDEIIDERASRPDKAIEDCTWIFDWVGCCDGALFQVVRQTMDAGCAAIMVSDSSEYQRHFECVMNDVAEPGVDFVTEDMFMTADEWVAEQNERADRRFEAEAAEVE